MEIINPSFALLSNFEVIEALRNIGETKKYARRNLATISYETVRFLDEGPCKTQTKENILEFLKSIKPFKLTKNESLMLVNDPPTLALHIQLIVEDSEERLTEDQVNQLLELSQRFLLPNPESNDAFP